MNATNCCSISADDFLRIGSDQPIVATVTDTDGANVADATVSYRLLDAAETVIDTGPLTWTVENTRYEGNIANTVTATLVEWVEYIVEVTVDRSSEIDVSRRGIQARYSEG